MGVGSDPIRMAAARDRYHVLYLVEPVLEHMDAATSSVPGNLRASLPPVRTLRTCSTLHLVV
jgi:hypothetical protein